MQSAALAKQVGREPAIRVPVSATSRPTLETPADRLNLAKGTLIGIVLSVGLWAAVIKLVALLRN